MHSSTTTTANLTMTTSADNSESVQTWLHIRSTLLVLIMIITLVLNTFLIMVLRKMKSRRCKTDSASHMIETSYTYLLFHLAFSDMLGVVLNIPFDIVQFAGVKYMHYGVGCTLLAPIQLASTSAQAGTYVALSYHRFRAIVYPIRANLTVCKSVIMICIVWAVGVSLSLPYAIVNRLTDDGCMEEWPQGTLSSNVYTFAIFIVQYAAPVTLMAAFYFSIARALREHRTPELGKTQAHEDIRTHRRIVKMLVTIVTVYSVCMLPHHLVWIINGLQPMSNSTFDTCSQVSYLFTYSNTVANPAVFFLYNKESRFHLKQMFRKWCKMCCRPKPTDIPFEIDVNMWSGSWSANSKSDNNNQSERKSLRTDRVRLNQLFPTQPGDSELGVSLPWEAQVLSGSHDTIDEVEECQEFQPSLSPPVRDVPIDASMRPAEVNRNDRKPPPSVSIGVRPVENETDGLKTDEINIGVPSANGTNGLKMNGISEELENGSLSEDETERVQNLIKGMVLDLEHEIRSSRDEGGCYGDTLSTGDASSIEGNSPRDSGNALTKDEDIPNNNNNGYVTNDRNIGVTVDIPKDGGMLVGKNGNHVRNGHIGNTGGGGGKFLSCGDQRDSAWTDGSDSFSPETGNNKHVTGAQELVNDAIHFLDQQSPQRVRDIDELREHLWNLREDDV